MIQVFQFIESFSYFSLSSILTLYFTDQFLYSDLEAGTVYSIYNFLLVGYGIILGQFVDRLGVKTSLIVGSILLVIGRAFLFVSTGSIFTLCIMFSLLSWGTSFVGPALQIAIKRVTNKLTRPAAFSLFYVVMNIAALCSGWMIDGFRAYLPRTKDNKLTGATWDLGFASFQFNYERAVLMVGFIVTIGFLPAAFCCVRKYDSSEDLKERQQENVAMSYWKVFRERRFWKFLAFIFLLCFIKKIFRYLDSMFGKFSERVLGPEVPWATIVTINPFLILFLVPLSTPLSFYMNGYTQILVGSFISGISPFALAISPTVTGAIVFIVVLSLGEAIWSPRLYEYSISIIEKGKEGIYLGLASSNYFFGALLSGLIGGGLVEELCPPKPAEQNPRLLWGPR